MGPDCVELLLNYKKTGEPFWNLLYTAPLYNQEGQVVFFISGQINCSTTIHSCSDILRILSISENNQEENVNIPSAAQPALNSAFRFLKAFRSAGSLRTTPQPEIGLENGLLNKMEKLNLRKQMDQFYTAYSKYLVINYDTFFVSFYSRGITEVLYPAKAPIGIGVSQSGVAAMALPIVGTDVFRFLGAYASSLMRDFKQQVRQALKMGKATSVGISLCTRRFMGFERFVTHWTPLKDDTGKVAFVVLTLGAVRT